MRKCSLLILSLILLSLSVQAQVKRSALIFGTVDPSVDTVELAYHGPAPQYPARLRLPVKQGKVETNFEMIVAATMDLTVAGKTWRIFPAPFNELRFEVKAGNISFSGPLAEANRALQDFDALPANAWDLAAAAASKTADLVELDLFQHRAARRKWMTGLRGEIPAELRLIMALETEVHYLGGLLRYEFLRDNSLRALRPLPRIMQEEIRNDLRLVPNALCSHVYSQYLLDYMTYFAAEQQGFQGFTSDAQVLELTGAFIRSHLEGEMQATMLLRLITEHCETLPAPSYKTLIGYLNELDPGGAWSGAAAKRCDAAQAAKIAAADKGEKGGKGKKKGKKKKNEPGSGTPAPSEYPFTLYDMTGKEVRLEDFRGKVVYIDFWASWCGPCRAQFPYSAKLHESLSPKQQEQIVFLYINLDDAETNWKTGVEQNKIQGTHVWCPGGFGAKVAQYFQVNSIPRYMILNKKGEFVTKDATRPSEAQTRDELLRLLAE